MQQGSQSFTTADIEKCNAFGEFINKFANWDVSTVEAIKLTKHLGWYNSLLPKIKAHIAELTAVVDPNKDKKDVD